MSGKVLFEYPKLRPVEAFTAQENLICLRDPLGFSDKVVFLPQEIFFIVSLFDGRHSILDIQAEYTRRFGELLFSDRVRQIIEQLDSCLFLEGRRFADARDRAVAEFKEAAVRAAWHAGTAYEREPQALRRQLESLFTGPEGPGLPVQGFKANEPPPSGRLRGLIAPHIDLGRGGACFAWSYAELARQSGASTFVVLGISHTETRRRYVLTAKDFVTPLGVVPADREFIAGLAARCRSDFFEDEFVHRSEHSVEFQALLLRYIYPDQSELKIVPVLCTSLPQAGAGGVPEQNAEAQEFIAALKAALEERGAQAGLIAGVDLSHVGRRFGQDLALSDPLLKSLETQDRNMIQRILERDAAGFFRLIQEEQDRRNVCGVPAIYTLLRLLGAGSSRLLRYGQAADFQSHSVVTFMSAAFYQD